MDLESDYIPQGQASPVGFWRHRHKKEISFNMLLQWHSYQSLVGLWEKSFSLIKILIFVLQAAWWHNYAGCRASGISTRCRSRLISISELDVVQSYSIAWIFLTAIKFDSNFCCGCSVNILICHISYFYARKLWMRKKKINISKTKNKIWKYQ